MRPWIDTDGQWYATIATDGCNATTKHVPCGAGGRIDMWTSPYLRGPRADWRYVGPLIQSNRTVLTGHGDTNLLEGEFITAGYFGALPGDPRQGRTRVFTNNINSDTGSDTTMYFIGVQQQPGAPLTDAQGGWDFAAPGETGMFDWGAFGPRPNVSSGSRGLDALVGGFDRVFSMARTLGSASNQVREPGRRVIVAWIGGTPAQQSLLRDLWLGPDATMRQAFVPELQKLRQSNATAGGQQLELLVNISAPADFAGFAGVAVLGLATSGVDAAERTLVGVDFGKQLVLIDGTAQGNANVRAGPLYGSGGPGGVQTANLHIYVDHSIVTVIANQQTGVTALVQPSSAAASAIAPVGLNAAGVKGSVVAYSLASI